MPRLPDGEPAPASGALPDGALSTWRLIFAAIALFGFAGAAAFILLEVRRRRTDVLNRPVEADVPLVESYDVEMDAAIEQRHLPTFAPLPPMGTERKAEDDIEDAMRHFTQGFRRRAA